MGKGFGIFFMIIGALSFYFRSSLPVFGSGIDWGFLVGPILFVVGVFMFFLSRPKRPYR